MSRVHAMGVLILLLFYQVYAETAQVWPKPQVQTQGSTWLTINSEEFVFKLDRPAPLVDQAFSRYKRLCFTPKPWLRSKRLIPSTATQQLRGIQVSVQDPDVPLRHGVDESYQLLVQAPFASIKANTSWGALRGLESFSQLLMKRRSDQQAADFAIVSCSMTDFPRFAWRGLLIDTSRHFLPLSQILSTIDAMEWNKLNVLHWHIVDDQSFPFKSTVLPLLSEKGAWDPDLVYTAEDVLNVKRYANARGVRVMVELDSPGHTYSWGLGYPQLLTSCLAPDGQPTGELGPIDPTHDLSYSMLQALIAELDGLFDDDYFHIGGDEVDFTCWKSDPRIASWMAQHNISSYGQLQGSYTKRVADIVSGLGRAAVVWQEALDQDPDLPSEVVVHVWIKNARTGGWSGKKERKSSTFGSRVDQWDGERGGVRSDRRLAGSRGTTGGSFKGGLEGVSSVRGWQEEMEFATGRGHQVLLSAPWYLDQISWREDWRDYYNVEPLEGLSQRQRGLVLGGEACLWGEYVDATNLLSRTWPRASAVAARLWSAAEVGAPDMIEVASRLDQHRCRMVARGIPAQPLFPSYCPGDNAHIEQQSQHISV